ncbi:MAG: hypothetical protein H8E40_06355 [Chloroflexi bacterium]|nr:hypothetical protein [Chloroflexota bacterium]
MRGLKLFLFVVFIVILTSLVGLPFAFSDIALGVNGNRAIYSEGGAAIVTSGRAFDKVLIQGTGVTAGGKVDIYWDSVSAEDASTGSGYKATATGTTSGTFSLKLTIPSTSVGPHYVWIQDVTTRETIGSNVFNVLPKITLSSDKGYIGDNIEVKGYGFEQDSNIDIKSANNTDIQIIGSDSRVKTDLAGYFICNIRVPDFEYGSYNLTIFDEDNNLVNTSFTVNAIIDLTPAEGPSGSIIHITGRGFNPGNTINSGNILFDDVAAKIVTEGPIKVSNNGEISVEILAPSIYATSYPIEIIDGAISTSTDFKVTHSTQISISPDYGLPGEEITVEGSYFSNQVGNTVSVFIDGVRMDQNVSVDQYGLVSGEIVLPAYPLGASYDIRVVDEYGLKATTQIVLDYVAFTLSEYSGATGSAVDINMMGLSLLDVDEYAVHFGEDIVIPRTDIDNGPSTSASFYVPHNSLGIYEVRLVTYPDDVITTTKRFNLSDQSVLTLSAETVTRGGNITLSGKYFPESAALTPIWSMHNGTWSEDISDYITDQGQPVKTYLNGTVKGYFDIPFDINRGKYVINCSTYSNDDLLLQFAELEIKITYDVLNVSTRMHVYHLGDTITFDINALDKNTSFTLYINDPNNELYWTCAITPDEWIKRETRWGLPIYDQLDDLYNNSFTLPNDSVPGDWTWGIQTDMNVYQKSGMFIVEEHMDDLILDKLNTIIDKLANMSASNSNFETITSAASINITLLQQDMIELSDALHLYNVDELDNALHKIIVDIENHNLTFNSISAIFPGIDKTFNETIDNLSEINDKYSDVESTYNDMSSVYNDKFVRNTLVRSLILSFVSALFLVLSVLRRAGISFTFKVI